MDYQKYMDDEVEPDEDEYVQFLELEFQLELLRTRCAALATPEITGKHQFGPFVEWYSINDGDSDYEADYEDSFFPNCVEADLDQPAAAAASQGDDIETELKHSRFSMLPTTDYFTSELAGKLPDHLPPSTGIRFADIPNGLAAISKERAPIEALEDELGVQDPVGFWDLAGLTVNDDVVHFQRQRQTRLKCGRSPVPATMGYFTPELEGKLPGYLSPSMGVKFTDVPHGLAAISTEHVPVKNKLGVQDPVGSWDPAGFMANDNVEYRFTMPATMGYITPELVGKLAGYLSPHGLVAISNEHVLSKNKLGVQDPEGFWDPAGYMADDNVEHYQHRRQTELKHSRLVVLATMGCITPARVSKLPGYLSPPAGIKFADVLNGLADTPKVPSAGWAQILAYSAFCEHWQDKSLGIAASQGDFFFKGPASSDPAAKQKNLAAEVTHSQYTDSQKHMQGESCVDYHSQYMDSQKYMQCGAHRLYSAA